MALILDLDGTTVASGRDARPSPRVKAAIAKANQKIIVSVATGRPLFLADYIFNELGITAPCVLDGGAEVIDIKTGKTLFKKYIAPAEQKDVFRICQRFKIPLATNIQQYETTIQNEEQLNAEAAKLFIDGVSKDVALTLLEEFEAIDGIAPHLASSWSGDDVVDIHITAAGATKKHGVEELLKILGLKKEEVLGIGDNHNDLPMLEAVGFKVVMGNAPEEIREYADFVAPSLNDDGVAAVIERFIL
jgi:HAD superfamily hydrolase (TIGR01484 family)